MQLFQLRTLLTSTAALIAEGNAEEGAPPEITFRVEVILQQMTRVEVDASTAHLLFAMAKDERQRLAGARP